MKIPTLPKNGTPPPIIYMAILISWKTKTPNIGTFLQETSREHPISYQPHRCFVFITTIIYWNLFITIIYELSQSNDFEHPWVFFLLRTLTYLTRNLIDSPV